ncbi:2-amino-4-hydroxy-6-hydroxymethyldihydropteridine diphosphokinase [Desulfobulbus sp. TB]|nr:2-amino-4-hydroxy-6-hydroxymethyldihydropteridine diphosphokinase [Desulfobulbus sp. TB]
MTNLLMNSNPLVHTAYIGLGSNLGQSHSLLLDAWKSLAQHPDIKAQPLSSPYRTKPVGMKSKHWFINAVGQLSTRFSPEALLDLLLATELRFGRVRHPEQEGYQDRTLDLDLLLYDNCIMQTDRLVLPHPAMHERLFVLIPLAEIDRKILHPVVQQTVGELVDILAGLAKQAEQGIEQISW